MPRSTTFAWCTSRLTFQKRVLVLEFTPYIKVNIFHGGGDDGWTGYELFERCRNSIN